MKEMKSKESESWILQPGNEKSFIQQFVKLTLKREEAISEQERSQNNYASLEFSFKASHVSFVILTPDLNCFPLGVKKVIWGIKMLLSFLACKEQVKCLLGAVHSLL